MSSPTPEQAARFRADLSALAGKLDRPFGLAVSGGPDSVALLLLAKRAGLPVVAATVDHGLRPEAAAEAAFVDRLCAERDIPHDILRLGKPDHGNLSDWARRARYEALDRWANQQGAAFVLTAHHADDQLETMLMRLNRGSGVTGLAGIRARQGRLLRPLLGWRRDELAGIVRAAGIAPVDDPSNRDDAYDRARLRKRLASSGWLSPLAANASAWALGEADEALRWATEQEEGRRVKRNGDGIAIDWAGLPDELARRILLASLAELNPGAPKPRADAVSRLLNRLRDGGVATLAGVRCAGGESWTLTLAPARRPTKAS